METKPFSILPHIHPRQGTTRLLRKEEIAPSTDESSCNVCQKCEARYVCPKCQIPYCSLSCYRSHGESCTEIFYQEKVNNVLSSEAKDNQAQTRAMLNRIHHERNAGVEDDEDEEEQLWNLLDALETGDDDFESLMSPALRQKFQQALESGELAETTLRPWRPWWKPDYTLSSDDSANELPPSKLLDDRLLRIKPFSTLWTRSSLPALEFNLLELLYSIAATLRCFHGVYNAKRLSSVEATSMLLSLSKVLDTDARYGSTHQVLLNIASSSPRHHGLGFTTERQVLLDDVVDLWGHRRHVCHALVDAIDVVKAAEKHQPDSKGKLRKVRKKVEFYLSWSREAPVLESEEIGRLVREWRHEVNHVDLAE